MSQIFDRMFDDTMRPLDHFAQDTMTKFARWVVSCLQECGVRTRGFGYIPAVWCKQLIHHDYLMEDFRRWLTKERLAYVLARVFFTGDGVLRCLDDGMLCLQTARFAEVYGLVGTN